MGQGGGVGANGPLFQVQDQRDPRLVPCNSFSLHGSPKKSFFASFSKVT